MFIEAEHKHKTNIMIKEVKLPISKNPIIFIVIVLVIVIVVIDIVAVIIIVVVKIIVAPNVVVIVIVVIIFAAIDAGLQNPVIQYIHSYMK